MKEKTMNKTKQIRQITIETHSITIIRTSGGQLSAFCERCRETVPAFAPEQLAAVLQKTIAEILGLIENGELHLTAFSQDAPICGGKRNNGIRLFSVREPNL